MRFKSIILIFLCLFIISLFISPSYAKIDKKNVKGVWLFNEGNGDKAKDSSGLGNDGVLKANPKWVNGKFGKALEFNGTNGVEISNPDNFNFLTWTYSFWFQTPAGGDYPNLVGRQFGNAHGWTIHLDPGRATFRIRIDTDGGINQVKTVPGQVGDQEWHHGVICHEEKNKKLTFYFDGVKGESSYTGEYKNSGGFLVVALQAVGAVNLKAGIIDDFAIFDSILGEDDVNAIMKNGLEATIPGLMAVSPEGRLTNTWGSIKAK